MEKEFLLTQLWVISTTLSDETVAKSMAKALLDARLAACVQIAGPIRSFYRWKESLHEDLEWKLSIKTSRERLEACWQEILRIHPYEVPELIAEPVVRVTPEYEGWVLEQVADGTWNVPATLGWHLRMVGMGSKATVGNRIELFGHTFDTLDFPEGPNPLSVSFEAVQQGLSQLPNLHFEPDGSFVWRGSNNPQSKRLAWQLDGMVYDRDDRVEYVELKGNCDRSTWKELIRILSGVDRVRLAVQWVETGSWISEAEFNKWFD